ncbi:MAG: extensin family protein [Hyphomicrobium sp.]
MLMVTAGLVGYAALTHGAVPSRFNPLAPPDLTEPDAWFLDARLSRLRHDRAACALALRPTIIAANLINDSPYKDGCGWVNAARVSTIDGVRLPIDVISCEMAAALAMWTRHVVQPSAIRHFNSPVASIQNFGGYACRNIIGSKLWGEFRSQHATANALDISALILADGRRVAVKSNWAGNDANARFMHEIHDGACRYFRAVLGPDYNAAHHDHFHLDRGYISSCK